MSVYRKFKMLGNATLFATLLPNLQLFVADTYHCQAAGHYNGCNYAAIGALSWDWYMLNSN